MLVLTPLGGSAAAAVARPALDGGNDRRALAAAIGLATAGIAPPILVTIFPWARDLIRPPLAADILFGLLVLAPAAVGLAVVLLGLARIVDALQRGAVADAEQAVLRVLAATLLFGCTLGWMAGGPADSALSFALPVAAGGLAAAWALLLWVILWGPAALSLRRRCATALDLALLSAVLHLGDSAAAGLYPVYLILAFYAGYRFGERALIETVLGSLVGFGLVVLTTEFWRGQPELAVGLSAALIVLPACLIAALRKIAATREAAGAAEASKAGALATVADALRPPLAAIIAGPAEPSTRILAERINDLLDVVAVETGQFPVTIEAFDLRALITHQMAQLSPAASETGVGLRWRIDPRLPPLVRGPSQPIGRILGSLAGHIVGLGTAHSLRVALDTIDRAADRVMLRLRIDAEASSAPQEAEAGAMPGQGQRAAWEREALTVGVVTRLAALIGGEFSIEGGPGPPSRFVVTFGVAIEPRAAETDLDLHGQPVLIVSADEAFAGEMAELLGRWHAEAHCLGDTDAAGLEDLGLGSGICTVAIVDGRDQPLAALAFADNLRKAGAGADAPFVLFVGESSRIERLTEIDEPALDCLIPAPVSERLLANALRGLPLASARRDDRNAEPRARPGGDAEASNARVTPIAAHPKFAPDVPAVVDFRAIEALRALGGGEAFLRELIDTFRADAQQLLQRLHQAVSAADAADFVQGIAALRRCAAHLGGRRLCEMLPASADINEPGWRERSALLVERLPAEIDRLTAAVQGCLAPKQAQGS